MEPVATVKLQTSRKMTRTTPARANGTSKAKYELVHLRHLELPSVRLWPSRHEPQSLPDLLRAHCWSAPLRVFKSIDTGPWRVLLQ